MDEKVYESLKLDKEQQKIRQGVVKEVRKYNVNTDCERKELIVDSSGITVVIPEEEVVLYRFSSSLLYLIRSEVSFMITDIVPDEDTVFGSMKLAQEKRQAPTISRMKAGETLNGTIVTTTRFGAYIDVGNGVQGLLRNKDFAADGTAVTEVYPQYSEIKVKYLRTTEGGTILFKPLEVREGGRIEDIVKHRSYPGRVSSVFPDKVFVTIRKNVDCLCSVPPNIPFLREGMKVIVQISAVRNTDTGMRLRGTIQKTLN